MQISVVVDIIAVFECSKILGNFCPWISAPDQDNLHHFNLNESAK